MIYFRFTLCYIYRSKTCVNLQFFIKIFILSILSTTLNFYCFVTRFQDYVVVSESSYRRRGLHAIDKVDNHFVGKLTHRHFNHGNWFGVDFHHESSEPQWKRGNVVIMHHGLDRPKITLTLILQHPKRSLIMTRRCHNHGNMMKRNRTLIVKRHQDENYDYFKYILKTKRNLTLLTIEYTFTVFDF